MNTSYTYSYSTHMPAWMMGVGYVLFAVIFLAVVALMIQIMRRMR